METMYDFFHDNIYRGLLVKKKAAAKPSRIMARATAIFSRLSLPDEGLYGSSAMKGKLDLISLGMVNSYISHLVAAGRTVIGILMAG